MIKTEYQHRLAYAERQFTLYKARVEHCHLKAGLAIATGDYEGAKRELDIARSHLAFVNDCNDTIDEYRRALDVVPDSKANT